MDEVPTKEQMRKIWRFRMTNMCYGCAAATIGFHVLLLQWQGLSASTVGIVMSVNAALSAIAPPIWGLVADKLRSRYKVFIDIRYGSGAVERFYRGIHVNKDNGHCHLRVLNSHYEFFSNAGFFHVGCHGDGGLPTD